MRLLAVPVVFALLLLGGIKLLGLDHAAQRASSAHEPRDAPAAPGASRAKSDADVRNVISYWSRRIGRDVQAVHRMGRRGDIDRFDDAARRLRADCLRARAAVAAQPATTERGLQAKRLAAHGFLLFARAGRQLDLAVTTVYSGGAAGVLAHARHAGELIARARHDLGTAQALLSPEHRPSLDNGSPA